MFREGYEEPITDRELAYPDDSGELCGLEWTPGGRTMEYGCSDKVDGSEYAARLGCTIGDVMLNPIISGPRDAGGLAVPDIEAADMEGESE